MAVFRCDDKIAENSLARAAKSSNKLLHFVGCVILNYEVFFLDRGRVLHFKLTKLVSATLSHDVVG